MPDQFKMTPFNEKYLDAMYYSIQNADQFLLDAHLLLKKKSYGHASSLAIIGLEECAKALRYYLTLMDGIELEKNDEFLRSHKIKQLYSIFFKFYFQSPFIDFLEESMELYIKGKMKDQKKEFKIRLKLFEKKVKMQPKGELNYGLLDEFLAIIIDFLDLPTFLKKLEVDIQNDPSKMEELKKYAERIKKDFNQILFHQELEKRKWSGLYVDCHADGFTHPFNFTKSNALEDITNLDDVLEIITDAFGFISPNEMTPEEKQERISLLQYLFQKIQTQGI